MRDLYNDMLGLTFTGSLFYLSMTVLSAGMSGLLFIMAINTIAVLNIICWALFGLIAIFAIWSLFCLIASVIEEIAWKINPDYDWY